MEAGVREARWDQEMSASRDSNTLPTRLSVLTSLTCFYCTPESWKIRQMAGKGLIILNKIPFDQGGEKTC